MTKRPASIMMIEDNMTDIKRTRSALKHARVLNELTVFQQAEPALADLTDPSRPLPDLILLDLSLPGMSGLDFLQQVKAAPELKRIPVCTVSSSQAEADIAKSWDLGVVGYIVKPIDLATLQATMEHLATFYLEIVVLPPKSL